MNATENKAICTKYRIRQIYKLQVTIYKEVTNYKLQVTICSNTSYIVCHTSYIHIVCRMSYIVNSSPDFHNSFYLLHVIVLQAQVIIARYKLFRVKT